MTAPAPMIEALSSTSANSAPANEPTVWRSPERHAERVGEVPVVVGVLEREGRRGHDRVAPSTTTNEPITVSARS